MNYEYSKKERRWYFITLILLALATGFYIVCQEPEQLPPANTPYSHCAEWPAVGMLCLRAKGHI